ncbi:MAG: phosphoenolpyruvate--protein phosphotransferase [Phycisphaerales bacterium]|nr:phosphoenolpyruvate--protein phosphotransferase [Phycisphaerales bacterium]
MPVEFRFTCPLVNGIHARPASVLADVVRGYRARVTIARDGAAAVELVSVLSVVGLDIKVNQECVIVADGIDAVSAIAALTKFVEEKLASVDDVSDVGHAAGTEGSANLPMALRNRDVAFVSGRAVCGGIGMGAAVIVGGLALSDAALRATPVSVEAEVTKVRDAIAKTHAELHTRAKSAKGIAADLLRAHAAIADDPALRADIEKRISRATTAARAVVAAGEAFAGELRKATSAYIRDRAVDVIDVCEQILEKIGTLGGTTNVALENDSVVFAETLTANQLLKMDRSKLRGLVLGGIGATSHTVILARSFRIPTVIDVRNAVGLVAAGTRVIVDGEGGLVLTSPGDAARRYFEREIRSRERAAERVRVLAQGSATTIDDASIEVGVNASTPDEVRGATANGADGVGLLRTELLFLDRATAPSEEEQYSAYTGVVKAAAGRPVIIRTFDIGGDKPAAYLNMPEEENPFLGVRGLRLYEKHPDVLSAQLRAILRVALVGPVKIMAPMVSTPEEAVWFRERVEATRRQLAAEGVSTSSVPVGIMVEVPSVATVMDQLCEVVDFFSIGTNDLCQYWMAVDRGNAGVAGLYNARRPSFLRVLSQIVRGAKAGGRWIGMCGEMAGKRGNLPLLLGMGLDEISVAPGEVAAIKALVREARAEECRALLERACACRTPGDVDALVAASGWRETQAAAIVDRSLVMVESDATSKEEAIQEAIGVLLAAGRIERPRDVEDAVWAREATYSTGLGFGFAIPHCKSDAVTIPSLAVVKLTRGIEWGSLDGGAVSAVLLLVVPSSDAAGSHMKVFAKLARKLMHEDFRARLMGAASPEEVEACLRIELEIS